MPTVHVRVNDAATGRPTPCRVRFTDAAGRYCPPLGRLAEFATEPGVDVGGNVLLGGREYAFIDGTCEVPLPPGPVTVEVHKGPEYTPLREELTLGPGQLSLRLTLRRWIDQRQKGWYSGDTWAEFLTPDAALLEAAAEDVAVVNLLTSETTVGGEGVRQHRATPNLLSFSGQIPARERPGHLVVVNSLNHHDRLGSLALLNCHRVVYPLRFDEDNAADEWTLADWCDQCHRKGGLVVGHDFFGRSDDFPRGELLADVILGKVDALETNAGTGHSDNPALAGWYALLDAGFRVPLVGGSKKSDNLGVLGSRRTYARLAAGDGLGYKAWVEAVRAGRTFVTNGPLLTFTFDGHDPGTVIDLSEQGNSVLVRAEARSLVPFRQLEVVYNGSVIAAADATGEPARAVVEGAFRLSRPGWLAARCWGDYDDFSHDWVGAQTSPVYVTVGGAGRAPDNAAVVPLLSALDTELGQVGSAARVRGLLEAARRELVRRSS